MKKVKQLALAMGALLLVQTVQAQTVDEVIDKYIAAIGGKSNLLGLKTVKVTGSISVQGYDVSIETSISHNIGYRLDINVPGMEAGFRIFTPSKGWEYLPFQGQSSPVDLTTEQVNEAQSTLDLQGALLNYKEKGHSVELQGKEPVDGSDCFKLKITYKSGRTAFWFIDATTYYRVKTITYRTREGQEVEFATTYSDFRKTPEGLVFSYAQVAPTGPTTVSSIEINKPMDESLFVVK
jgi:hypothetical protein